MGLKWQAMESAAENGVLRAAIRLMQWERRHWQTYEYENICSLKCVEVWRIIWEWILGQLPAICHFWHFSYVSDDLMVSFNKHVCSSSGSLTCSPNILLSGYLYLAFFSIIYPATFSSSSGRASRCSRAVPELLTGLVVSSCLTWS